MHLEPILPQRSALPPLKNFRSVHVHVDLDTTPSEKNAMPCPVSDIVIAYYRSFAGMVSRTDPGPLQGISLSHFSEVGYRVSSMESNAQRKGLVPAIGSLGTPTSKRTHHWVVFRNLTPLHSRLMSRLRGRPGGPPVWGLRTNDDEQPPARGVPRFSPGIALHERTAEAVGPWHGLHRPAHAHPTRAARPAHPLVQTEGVRVPREQRAKRLVLGSGWIIEGPEKQRNVLFGINKSGVGGWVYEQERVALKERPKRETQGKGRRSILTPRRPIL
ncbi:hypothetical protein EDB92DRAFT_1947960 [Lactarius akahatsu]|uniref:Uncharacterized protein n=1 Tax=Lactarius akahatsu TaxID=416441 RepID=A0AAD4LCH7_9AGAM|nr:hypothetical protein EDB92DRAFT_1947960 [Lactarius akahatsu]